MRVAAASRAPRKLTLRVACCQGAADGERNRAGLSADIQHGALGIVLQHHDGRIARKASRRFRGNVDRGVCYLQDGVRIFRALTRLDVQDHLVAISSAAAIQIRCQSGLRQETQRIRAALLARHLLDERAWGCGVTRLLKQPIGCGLERAVHHGSLLRREPAADDQHPVVVHPRAHRPAKVPLVGLPRGCHAVASSPAAHHAFDMVGGAGPRDVEELRFVRGRGDTRQRPHLGDDTSPRWRDALNSGRSARALATRTFSRAAPRSMPVRQCSQCAQDRKPLLQPAAHQVPQHHQQPGLLRGCATNSAMAAQCSTGVVGCT
jgi:hypothetical protein